MKGHRKLIAIGVYFCFCYAPILEFQFLKDATVQAYGTALVGMYALYVGALTTALKFFFDKNIEEHKAQVPAQ